MNYIVDYDDVNVETVICVVEWLMLLHGLVARLVFARMVLCAVFLWVCEFTLDGLLLAKPLIQDLKRSRTSSSGGPHDHTDKTASALRRVTQGKTI